MRRIGCLIMLAAVCLLSGGCDRIAIERVYASIVAPVCFFASVVLFAIWLGELPGGFNEDPKLTRNGVVIP